MIHAEKRLRWAEERLADYLADDLVWEPALESRLRAQVTFLRAELAYAVFLADLEAKALESQKKRDEHWALLKTAREVEEKVELIASKLKCSKDEIVPKTQALSQRVKELEQEVHFTKNPIPDVRGMRPAQYWYPGAPKELADMWWQWDRENDVKWRNPKWKQVEDLTDKILAICNKRGLTMYSFDGKIIVTAYQLYKEPGLWF